MDIRSDKLCLILLWSILVLTAFDVSATRISRPNIVFILADDLGWNDIGFNNPDIKSPRIDDLARSGVILNQSYVQPLCSPSRSAFMTGVYPFRLGLQHLVIGNNQAVCLPFDRPILPQVLKQAGYATHIVGKWHLGFCNRNCTPTYRGFDSFYGYYSGAEDHYTKVIAGGFDFRDNEQVVRNASGTYSTYQYTNRIKDIIASHDTKKPLFLYLPYQNVHQPLQVPEKYFNLYSNVSDKNRRTHNGMVSALDEAVGEMVDALKTKGIYNNTLLVFSADNGGMTVASGNNFPLRGGKSTIFEGGTRGAAFVHGPMFNKTGVRYDGLIHLVDWLPTLADAAGVIFKGNDIDGVSQWQSLLSLATPSKRQEIVYNLDDSFNPIQGKAAIRVGDYKLIDGYPGLFPGWYKPAQYHDSLGSVLHRDEDAMQGRLVDLGLKANKYLFNLKDDPTEHNNLYAQHPDIVKQLEARLEEHRKRMVAPKYPLPDINANPAKYGGAWSPGWC